MSHDGEPRADINAVEISLTGARRALLVRFVFGHWRWRRPEPHPRTPRKSRSW